MCGIVGVIGNAPAAPVLLEALRRLEYRGYDSAGIATLIDGHIDRRRAEGKLANLAAVLDRMPLPGVVGVGHTRWATHGAPTEGNAHPHGTSRVSVVHNGIIENHAELRSELEAEGQVFSTETDTETVAQLVDLHLARGMAPREAALTAFRRLEGAYALAMVFAGHPDLMIGAQHGAPLAIGYGEGEMFLGSDSLALSPLARRITYLRDGDWTVVSKTGAQIFDFDDRPVNREIKAVALAAGAIGKDGYRHYMEKELHEHPSVIGQTLRRMLDPATRQVVLPELPFDLATIPRITMTACGSAYYAGLVGRHWLESIARLPTDADVASELRYREPPLPEGGLGLLISQSGETADTLAALRGLHGAGQHVLSVLNVPESTMARESDAVLETVAGPEICVASTKAFTAQLCVLACLAIATGTARGTLGEERAGALTAALTDLPGRASELLTLREDIQAMAQVVAEARDVLYLGRGAAFPIALEGALKLKEISYIHAEAYAAGEMKHGPIALIDRTVPVVAIAPGGRLFEKTASNLQEAKARGARILAFTDADGAPKLLNIAEQIVVVPTVDPFVAPILHAIAVQMLAYEVALLKGTDVDQPRNLAKSVTVE
ncbi:glucosamine--fructose-6-phosphate aminotransferase (isomerizing) [Endobacter medicaginis]|uniref:Glutamine--fructose-6-phosphate aminotransferase [isomerizing] n=1 Tax=Endobacter medicaginis TaxID=1181271 RepID=A0A850NGX6_9PROT|nr:glutamine--fructose-6-phosphate transaminase (isomerizing) [Endobacter medicaginis]MBB3174833.1 glucosamine--fructose-6-phosphate aminotransferase (isomerizing) [Endobacter medicaginis]MCX5475635.1 glutamine--fructose-6-phosphate transaminase (isomerizing) [Endobacter medicaginis]NVN29121.1 glutamine--fructose-6-phosphate transaminase (isomerizing) [Endobacter medicaginis]